MSQRTTPHLQLRCTLCKNNMLSVSQSILSIGLNHISPTELFWLILIYVNNMSQAVKCDIFLYADDSCFTCQHKDSNEIVKNS